MPKTFWLHLLKREDLPIFSHISGRIVHRGSGAVVAETEYGLSEATEGLTKLDLRAQELKDMEVARKLQEEEIKVRKETRKCIRFCLFVDTKGLANSFMFNIKIKSTQNSSNTELKKHDNVPGESSGT